MGNASLVSSTHQSQATNSSSPSQGGSTAATSAPGGGLQRRKSSKKIVSAKLSSAEKTGVLNLADQEIKATSSVWTRLVEPRFIHKLKSLDISSNQLKVLPLEVYGLVNLKSLQANSCYLQNLHDMSTFLRITTLKLSVNDLEEHTMSRLPPNLTHLHIAMNHFRSIPPPILELQLLVVLDLGGNRIKDLSGLETLTSLSELHLNDNMIESVPSTLGALVKLQLLNLRNNKISRSRKAISDDENNHGEEEKEIDHQSIAKEIFIETSLVTLQLAGNPLSTKEVLSFDGVEVFMDRWKATRDKSIQGGAMIEQDLFGLN